MKYKCIKEMCIQMCDGDGSWIENQYGVVPVDSEWHIDETSSILGGDVHLECISGCDDFGWIEISNESLKENFVVVGDADEED